MVLVLASPLWTRFEWKCNRIFPRYNNGTGFASDIQLDFYFQDISVRGFWMTRWIEKNFDSPERQKMYDDLSDMAANGTLSPPNCVLAHISAYKEVLQNCMKGYKPAKYIFELS